MILTTLVTGGQASAREAAIAAAVLPAALPLRTTVLLEGLRDGKDQPANDGDITHLQVTRIAPGCICCTGNLIMRVTLDRILRSHPDRLYIGIANAAHIGNIRSFLSTPPYDAWIQLTDDLQVAI